MGQNEVIDKLKSWAETNNSVRALVLTSSRVNNSSPPVDQFSDYDVSVYVNSLDEYLNDKWLGYFGKPLVFWPLKPQTTFSNDWLTRLVIFENRMRIDFQITVNHANPPADYDLGYQVLVDKDGITKNFPSSTKTKHLIKPPSDNEFLELINEFFWDATYVAKYLWRGDLFYAKYMLDSSLRFDYFEKMIEWYIGSQHTWQVSTNVHGRYFPKYFDQQTWDEIKQTFAGSNIEESWTAFIKMVELFTNFAQQVAKNLGYNYPAEQESKLKEYYQRSKALDNKIN